MCYIDHVIHANTWIIMTLCLFLNNYKRHIWVFILKGERGRDMVFILASLSFFLPLTHTHTHTSLGWTAGSAQRQKMVAAAAATVLPAAPGLRAQRFCARVDAGAAHKL